MSIFRPGSGQVFAQLEIYHDLDSRAAALNMAIDEALLETVSAPTIRFYRWDHPALSFGYFGKFEEVASYSNERDIVRRWTGGGIVFHGNDLTYSLIIPASDAAFGESSASIYENVHRAICAALILKGERAVICCSHAPVARPTRDWTAKQNGPQGRGYNKDACFANPVRADVMLNGKKIAGAAQRRTKLGLLQQGSIQNVDLGPDFEQAFAAQLSSKCRERELDGDVLDRAKRIADQKYAAAAWLRRR